ncbi:MAG: hypothetical protein EB150_08850 [Nitrososphaeria archaeon]|jgi:hypothetical protein|nr:hypothetical protein [Nitrososphaeria archaeon]
MFSIIDGLLAMKMDVYRQEEEQDPDTGVMKRQFMYYKTIPCYGRGIVAQNVTRNLDKQVFSNKYENQQYLEVRTMERLTQREKVGNIKDSEGNPIWIELNYPNDTPTIFEIVGSTPITDPFGSVVGYNTSLKRSENQQIGF